MQPVITPTLVHVVDGLLEEIDSKGVRAIGYKYDIVILVRVIFLRRRIFDTNASCSREVDEG